jgi:hypothetical protein
MHPQVAEGLQGKEERDHFSLIVIHPPAPDIPFDKVFDKVLLLMG